MDIEQISTWLEAHPVTVSIFEWVIIILIAWATGIFRLIRNYTRKSKVEIIDSASKCLVEKFNELDGNKNVVRASFLVDLTVINPTNEHIVIESFSLSFYDNKRWLSKSKELHPVTMPNRPRQEMGSGVKFSKVFFSRFADDMDDLTMSGNIPAKEFQNAYLLFVAFTFGDWNPKIIDNTSKIRISVKLTTGEILRSTQSIRLTENKEELNKWVPGFIDQISNSSAWNHFIK